MKEIKSNGYLHLKQGQIGDPRDPGLPWGLRESDIPGGDGRENISHKQFGESDVNWQGKDLVIYYTFSYNHDADRSSEFPISNVNVTKAIEIPSQQVITDPDILYSLKEDFEDQIDRDIQEQMENM